MKFVHITFSLLVLIIVSVSSFAQKSVTVQFVPVDPVQLRDTILPQFPDGNEVMYHYLSNNVLYPKSALDNDTGGSVRVKFKINTNGDIHDVAIVSGCDPAIDREAMRAVKSMPQWIPASVRRRPIEMSREVIFVFDLNEGLKQKNKQAEMISENYLPPSDTISVVSIPPQLSINTDTTSREPQFPGGQEALDAYLKANMKYPKRAKELRIGGRVIFNFTVSPKGKIEKIMLFKRLFPDCDEEAYYLIKKMPLWLPALKDGKPVSMQVMLPISFDL